MIIKEEILQELFSQLPKVVDSNNKEFTIKFNWGSQQNLMLFLKNLGNSEKYPLIWLVESNDEIDVQAHELVSNVKLIIAKQSLNENALNPKIWETEFKNTLNPILNNVITCFEKSGVTFLEGKLKVTKRANYSEDGGKSSFTIDNWNVIIFESKVIFHEKSNRQKKQINQIKF